MSTGRHPRGPEELKAAARELGYSSVIGLLALARKNDPYMCGGPADLRDAEWFGGLWKQFGYSTGVHLRRVHYQVFSTRGSTSTGESYENTDSRTARAGSQSQNAQGTTPRLLDTLVSSMVTWLRYARRRLEV